MDVKWQCLACGHVWTGLEPRLRNRRATCRNCGSWNVYPGWVNLEWTKVSAIIKREAGYACQKCGATGVPLETHHKIPVAAGGDSRRQNLIVLCEKCHSKEHGCLPILLWGMAIIAGVVFILWLLRILFVE